MKQLIIITLSSIKLCDLMKVTNMFLCYFFNFFLHNIKFLCQIVVCNEKQFLQNKFVRIQMLWFIVLKKK